ncbi:hypothetical protein Pla100_17970 [Neorhodopirellula pilleata]|uniref:Uncharacterized protein n=1 Tax=Neorhodopirellula pilleata TaxID=2714738 RepID=A0A5C6AR68_9BACT|nr:hypothetical protein Pla100_17970 [Neorhodopirellula pilleata]
MLLTHRGDGVGAGYFPTSWIPVEKRTRAFLDRHDKVVWMPQIHRRGMRCALRGHNAKFQEPLRAVVAKQSGPNDLLEDSRWRAISILAMGGNRALGR